MLDDQPPSAAALETLWLIRHVAQSARLRRPLAPAARLALAKRQLDPADCLYLLTRLAGALGAPLAIGPPCCTEHSHHERHIGLAIMALDAGDHDGLKRTLQRLAAPAQLTGQGSRQAGVVLARLAGCETGSTCSRGAEVSVDGAGQGFSP